MVVCRGFVRTESRTKPTEMLMHPQLTVNAVGLPGDSERAIWLPARIQCRSQHIPQRCLSILRTRDNASHGHHAAQQTPSPAANHALRTGVSQPTVLVDANTPSREFRILTIGQLGISGQSAANRLRR